MTKVEFWPRTGMAPDNKLRFPDMDLSDLFENISTLASDHKPVVLKRDAVTVDPMTIGNYVAIQGSSLRCRTWKGRGLHATPKLWLVDWIERNMMHVENDELFWKFVLRADGTTLITLSYNRIIGSKWLTLLPANVSLFDLEE